MEAAVCRGSFSVYARRQGMPPEKPTLHSDVLQLWRYYREDVDLRAHANVIIIEALACKACSPTGTHMLR